MILQSFLIFFVRGWRSVFSHRCTDDLFAFDVGCLVQDVCLKPTAILFLTTDGTNLRGFIFTIWLKPTLIYNNPLELKFEAIDVSK